MQGPYAKLFDPIDIGGLRIKNRIAMAPMGFPGLSDLVGVPTPRYVDYFVERARGGAGLLLTGMLKVEDRIENTTARRGPVSKDFTRPFADLTEAVHAHGAKMFVQLSAGFGYQARTNSVAGGPVAPSAMPSFGDPGVMCRALETAEVEQIVRAFGDAAQLLAQAGVDGVEVHGHGGFLIDQFTTALWNRRDDKYGGDLAGRLTFPIEILDEIKRRVGKRFPVTYRYGLKHYMKTLQTAALPGEAYTEIGRDAPEGVAMARLLQAAGYDGLAVDAGSLAGHYWAHPPIYQKHGCLLDMAALVKQAVTIPVIAVGRLDMPDLAAQVIADGTADMVSLARGLLADPYWPDKVRQNRVDDIRPCIGCHQACSEVIHGRELNSCTVNPQAGRERALEIKPVARARNILVAGGGVAGMEAARVSATRGHRVTLFEKQGLLGGHLIEACAPDDKKDIERLNAWYRRELDRLGVDIRMNTPVTPELIERERPDVAIVASGSTDVVPDISGITLPQVLTSCAVLRGEGAAGDRVVVVGAGENGAEVALWLAKKGKRVTVVELQSRPINMPVARSNRNMLLDSLALLEVPVLLDTALREVLEGAVLVASPQGGTRRIDCDTVVLAVGMRAEDRLFQTLTRTYPGLVYAIGDCQEPKNIMKAVWDGFEVGRTV